jgi:hypothetical protein
MAINKNHEFEELNGVKCGIVEKNASAERVAFLKQLLEFNKYEVIVVTSPPPKVPAAAKPATPPAADAMAPTPEPQSEAPPAPATFTIGVSDYTFNPTNAIFGRLLKTPDGHIVTLAYWEQKESTSHDEIPYYQAKV